MANSIKDLRELPEIDMLKDFGITLSGIQEAMVSDYESKYEEITGKKMPLYPGNPKRMELDAISGQIYQAYQYGAYLFKQNFLKYMTMPVLKNWGGNIGYAESNLKAATCTVEFKIDDAMERNVVIPKGTRVTAGDDVYFATDEECIIYPGELSVKCLTTCTEEGIVGNDYAVGQINGIADPVAYVSEVANVDISAGGQDEYDIETLREKTYLFPSTYSTAGPIDAYEYFVKKYSTDIISTSILTNNETSTVMIYILLSEGKIPDKDYCDKVLKYIEETKNFPDTDKVEVLQPKAVEYRIKGKYYVSTSKRDTKNIIDQAMQEAVKKFCEETHSHLGQDINPDMLVEYTRRAGAKRIILEEPVYQKLDATQVAICAGIDFESAGLEDD